jgi:acyl-CoA thioester hydrolase
VFRYEVTPRYLEVDQQGVVFNMWYLGWFDDAWAAFVASLGHSYPNLLAGGDDVMLVRSELEWSSGLRYGESATIEVSVEHLGRTSFTVRFDVRRGGQQADVSCRGRTVYVVVGTDGSGKRPIPAALRTAMEGHLVAGL